jgi:RHS repeat-associated protein
MSNTRNQCDGVGHATKSAISLDRDFAQLTQSYQAHGGEVNTGTTPQVQYSYADGSSNTIRITGMTYPNGRNVVDDYGTTPGYDKAGNMTRIPVPGTLPDGVAWNTMSLSDWDNLKLADWEEMTLDNVEGVYDAWNRMVRLHVGDTTLAEYTYDARGYRIRKDSYADGTLSDARHYYYTPGWQVVEERVGTSTSADRQFIWGLRYIDDLVLRDRDSDGNGTLDERRYCLQDGNWNTIALTSSTGTITERFSYDAYGVPTFLSGTGTVLASSLAGWETLYAGYLWDCASSLYAVRNRLYHPQLGVWLTRDPLGYSDGMDLHYLYLSLNGTDPLGLGWLSAIGSFVAGAVVGAAIGVAVGATIAALSPVAAGIVTVVAVGTAIGHVAALGVRAYHNDLSVDEAAFAGGAFVGGGIGTRFGYSGYTSGREFTCGKGFRCAPFGNRTGHSTGKYPHYHRSTPDPSNPGQSIPGQGIGRHRPWDSKSTDQSFMDRF